MHSLIHAAKRQGISAFDAILRTLPALISHRLAIQLGNDDASGGDDIY